MLGSKNSFLEVRNSEMNSVDTPDVIRGVGGESGIKVKSYSVKKNTLRNGGKYIELTNAG